MTHLKIEISWTYNVITMRIVWYYIVIESYLTFRCFFLFVLLRKDGVSAWHERTKRIRLVVVEMKKHFRSKHHRGMGKHLRFSEESATFDWLFKLSQTTQSKQLAVDDWKFPFWHTREWNENIRLHCDSYCDWLGSFTSSFQTGT